MRWEKNAKLAELNTKIATVLLDNLSEYKCLCCIKNYQKKLDENLK